MRLCSAYDEQNTRVHECDIIERGNGALFSQCTIYQAQETSLVANWICRCLCPLFFFFYFFGCNRNKLGFLQCCVLNKRFSSWKIYLDIYAVSANNNITGKVCTLYFFQWYIVPFRICLHSLVKRENWIYLFATSSFPVVSRMGK